MRHTKKLTAKRIDELALLKSQIAPHIAKIEELTLIVKDAGGGESSLWRAELVRMPKRVMVIKAHKQLRLYEKS